MPNPSLESKASPVDESEYAVPNTWDAVLENKSTLTTVLSAIHNAANEQSIDALQKAHRFALKCGLLTSRESATTIYNALITGAFICGNTAYCTAYYLEAIKNQVVDQTMVEAIQKIQQDHERTPDTAYEETQRAVAEAAYQKKIAEQRAYEHWMRYHPLRIQANAAYEYEAAQQRQQAQVMRYRAHEISPEAKRRAQGYALELFSSVRRPQRPYLLENPMIKSTPTINGNKPR